MSTAEGARDHAGRGLRFFVVGSAAAATHYVVALVAYEWFALGPGVANVLGYAAGFPVSYAGQRYWTFASTQQPHRAALPRYLLVQFASFTASQVLLLVAVRILPLPFWFILGAVLVSVAVGTYLLSRLWVFRT